MVIDQGLVLLLDALLYIARDHRAWAEERLKDSRRERQRAEERLGLIHVDVADRAALARYLDELLPGHVEVAARVKSGATLLRIRP